MTAARHRSAGCRFGKQGFLCEMSKRSGSMYPCFPVVCLPLPKHDRSAPSILDTMEVLLSVSTICLAGANSAIAAKLLAVLASRRSPDSGTSDFGYGTSKAGNNLRHQPASQLNRWLNERFAFAGKRLRDIAIARSAFATRGHATATRAGIHDSRRLCCMFQPDKGGHAR